MAYKQSNFNVEAPHATDIWRKPPHTNRFDAPYDLQPAFPLRQFSSARVTFKGTWEYKYDQGGILLCFGDLPSGSTDDADLAANSWIKAGVEFYHGIPQISFVGCDRFADWSLHPVVSGQSKGPAGQSPNYVTIELRRQGDENGSALWAYQLVLDEQGEVLEEFPIRECAWPFANEDRTIRLGAYAARPAPDPTSMSGKLLVHFREIRIVTA